MEGVWTTEAGRRDEVLTCLVADDHPAVLLALTAHLAEAGVHVLADARSGAEASAKIASLRPAVAVVDLRMPDRGGLDVVMETKSTSPGTSVVIYAAGEDKSCVAEAVGAGARGFVLKEAPLGDLVRAIETVGAGGIHVDPVAAGALATSPGRGLTEREIQVLQCLADGRSYEEAGDVLTISIETVRSHMYKAMKRLKASTRTHAVAIAWRESLIA